MSMQKVNHSADWIKVNWCSAYIQLDECTESSISYIHSLSVLALLADHSPIGHQDDVQKLSKTSASKLATEALYLLVRAHVRP